MKGKGIQVGIVKENQDKEKMHRILVEFPVHSTKGKTDSYWCRIVSPMAGKDRGLVVIPDIGTEVVVAFSAKSNQPYILGGVYNGKDDKPENYANEDKKNNLRVFWSRNDHMVIFDDAQGDEKVEFGAKATAARDVTSGPIYIQMNSAKKTINEYSDGSTSWEAKETISFKCKDFTIDASATIETKSSKTTAAKAGGTATVKSSGVMTHKGSKAKYNSGDTASPKAAIAFPKHNHPPMK